MFKNAFKRVVLLFATILFMSFLLTGCDRTNSPSSGDPVNPPPTNGSETDPGNTPPDGEQPLQVTLYYPNSDASGLVATERTIIVQNQEIIKALFNELGNPPPGLENPLPTGTALLNATVSEDGIATIDLSADFNKHGGGSAGEQMTIYSIVNTLTTLPNIQSVQFLMEGNKQASILGHVDTSTPIEREEDLILTGMLVSEVGKPM